MADDPPAASSTGDGVDAPPLSGVRLTDTQRAILTALCRPRADGNRYATPATNQEIAAEVFLSVDAVKAHLRALYRKFGVEPLPHNQKRARLVELVIEGGLIPAGEPGAGGGDQASPTHSPSPAPDPAPAAKARTSEHPPAAEAPAPDPAEAAKVPAPAPGPRSPGPGRPLIIGSVAAGAVALALTLVLTGTFSGGSSGDSPAQASTPARYREAVNGYCRLALEGQTQLAGASTAERARSYLGVIETMGGRFESLAPPAGEDRDLALFGNGLRRAADFTSLVAQGPPRAGTRESANVVAELTLAAGQVQAGALGYGLGRECSEIGSLVARSARNAAVTR